MKSDPTKQAATDAASEAREALATAAVVYTREQIETAMDSLAEQLSERLAGTNPLVLCVLQGGLMFTAGMLPRLNLMIELDYIHASRYNNRTSGDAIRWVAEPSTSLQGRTVLILDDIFDKGHTLAAIESYCREHGASEVVSAVLLFKRCSDQTSLTRCEFAALEVDDKYVFGYGMDYHGQLRYLDHICRLPDSTADTTTGNGSTPGADHGLAT